LPSWQNFLLFQASAGKVLILGLNTMSRADEFRKNADECRQQAAKSIGPLDKERWLKVAEQWLQMAQQETGTPDTGSDR
jgi:hypothetical protein